MRNLSTSAANFFDATDIILQYFSAPDSDAVVLTRNFDSYYGATVAIPTNDYSTNISITGKIVLIYSYEMKQKIGINYYTGVHHPFRYHLYNVLSRVFTNASVIDRYIELSDDPITAVNSANLSQDDIVIYNCAHLFENNSVSQVYSILDNINSLCLSAGIKLYVIYLPKYYPTTPSDYLTQSRHIELYTYINNNNKIYNIFDYLCRMDSKYNPNVSIFDNSYITHTGSYSANVCHIVSRYILREIFKIYRTEYFVSFMYRKITSSTYSDFIRNSHDYMSEEFSKLQFHTRSIRSKYGWNTFKNTGYLISVGVHTSFSPKLWMCEQGGITCNKEEDEEINDIDLLPFYRFEGGGPSKKLLPPVFPTTGCPWFTIADSDISLFGISKTNPIHLYINHTGYGYNIALRFCDSSGMRSDVWQHITFGEFNGREDSWNVDSFYCAGGNQALSPDSWVYYPPASRVDGVSYDLRIRNSALVNGGILHPFKFSNTNMTNFRVRLRDNNYWEDIYSGVQDFKEYQYMDSVGRVGQIYTWGYPLTKPDYSTNNYSTAFPYFDWVDKVDTYLINDNNMLQYKSSGPIMPLVIYIKSVR